MKQQRTRQTKDSPDVTTDTSREIIRETVVSPPSLAPQETPTKESSSQGVIDPKDAEAARRAAKIAAYVKPPRKPRKSWMCSAHLSDGSGDLCQKPAIKGLNVCKTHGGGTANARAAAQARIAKMLPKAHTALEQLLTTTHQPSKLGAVKTVYERSVLGPVQQGVQQQAVQIVFGNGWTDIRPTDAPAVHTVEGAVEGDDPESAE